MNTVKETLSQQSIPAGSVRILTGATYSGKRAIYISGSAEGFRLLAALFTAQAQAAENEFTKLERDEGDLQFMTTDSVDVFELHKHHPAAHHPRLE